MASLDTNPSLVKTTTKVVQKNGLTTSFPLASGLMPGNTSKTSRLKLSNSKSHQEPSTRLMHFIRQPSQLSQVLGLSQTQYRFRRSRYKVQRHTPHLSPLKASERKRNRISC